MLAAVLREVAGHLGSLLGADTLDVGRVGALAARLLVCDRAYIMGAWRILLDSGEKACRRSSDSDARSDGEYSEDGGGLCEHGVEYGVFV